MATVNDIMTKEIIHTTLETPVVEAATTLLKNNFDGLPVIDKENNLVGILTDHDLIIKESSIHLPTFINLFNKLDFYKKDQVLLKYNLKRILWTKVRDLMNPKPLTVKNYISSEEIIKVFKENPRVNPILVLDSNKKLVGVVSKSDLIKFFNNVSLDDTTPLNNYFEREADKNVNVFLKDIKYQFVIVSKARVRLWLIVSILFALVGYAIAWALILRIN